MTKQKILLLTLEFPHWSDAAKYSYEANFGLEEGLLAQGADCLTIPMMFGNGDLSWARWFDVIRARLQGKSFDQVWFEVTHSGIPAPFLEFIDLLAPVRLGFVCESIEDSPQCIAWNPGGAQMRNDNLARNLKHTTHLVVVDEADFVRFNREGKTPAFWWAGMHVPGRVIAAAPQPATTAPAEFYGTPYGERAQWLTHPELAGLLTSGTSLESGTPYPAQWNRLSQKLHTALGAGKEIREEMFYSYINLVRNARRETYPLWLKSLTSGAAVVSLPSFILAYTGRVAQGMAAGRPVVCCEIPDRPRTSKLFENGKEILLYSCDHPAELAEHIRHIQRDPAFGQKIARNALGKMRRFHTVEKFVANILTWIENGAEPDYGDNIGARATPAPAWIARSAIPVVAAVIADQAVPAKGTDLTQLQARGLARDGQPLRLHLGLLNAPDARLVLGQSADYRPVGVVQPDDLESQRPAGSQSPVQLLERAEAIPAVPRSVLARPSAYWAYAKQQEATKPGQARCIQLETARVVMTEYEFGVITREGYLLQGTAHMQHDEVTVRNVLVKNNWEAPTEIKGCALLPFGRQGLDSYWHFTTGVIANLLLAKRHGLFVGVDHIILPKFKRPVFLEIFQACGLPVDKVIILGEGSHVCCERLKVVAHSGLEESVPRWKWGDLHSLGLAASANEAVPKSDKVLIQRRGGTRGFRNSEQVIALCEEFGFRAYDLEGLSFARQTALFARAKQVVAAHGSALTNIFYCQPSTKICEIFNPWYTIDYFRNLAIAGELEHTSLVGQGHRPNTEIPARLHDPIEVDLDLLREWLEAS